MPLNFAYSRIRAEHGSFRNLYDSLKDSSGPNPALEGAQIWGAFYGLFGLASNELILVTMGDVSEIDRRMSSVENISASHTLYLQPTVRPEDYTPRDKDGLYVFRFFQVKNRDIDEIANLSKTAWETFETTDEYNAIPQALFCEQDRSRTHGRMLLCTWYDGLNSWQTSRNPPSQASENFQARARLTLRTKAYATRLITS